MLQAIRTKAIAGFQAATNGGVAQAFFGVFQGRCTFAAICFSVIGVIGWWRGKDMTGYCALVTVIQALLVTHSWKSDVHERWLIKNGKTDPQ